jgi:hypothetical protein
MLHRPDAVAPGLLALLDRIVTVKERATGLRTLVSTSSRLVTGLRGQKRARPVLRV